MQILEVKNNIAKIIYNPADHKLLPADFLLIEDPNQKLIAQIINVETTDKEEENLAILRLALTIDQADNLSYYNGYIPAKNSKLIYITPEEIVELVEGNENNIYFGNLTNHPSCFVKTNISFVDENLYIQSDRADKTNIIVNNLVSELKDKDRKIVLIDFDGQYLNIPNASVLKICENIKLPLNIDAFDTILEYDTVDCPIEDKAVIQSIVLELREYLKTLKDKYIPFNMFKQVVDDEFASNPVSGLMLLRNKLWLYSQDSLFADKKEQFDVINSLLFNKDIVVVDASEIDEKWYKFVIQTVATLTSHDAYLFLSLNDVNIDKKSLMNLYNIQNIIPVVSTSYDNKYRQILKSLCKNHLLSKPQNYIEEQAYYTPLLNRLNTSDIILFGDTTLNLPLVIELYQFDSTTTEDVEQNQIKRDVDKMLSSPQTVIPKTKKVLIEEFEPEAQRQNLDDIDIIVEEDSVDDVIEQEEQSPIELQQSPEIKEDVKTQVKQPSTNNVKKASVVDDDFNDSDFEFLDEVSTSSSDDDILNVPFDLHYDNPNDEIMKSSKYDVFEPVPVQKINCDIPLEDNDSSDSINEIDVLDDLDEVKLENENETVEEVENSNIEEDVQLDEISEVEDDEQETMSSIDDVIDDITNKYEQEESIDDEDIQDESEDNSEVEEENSDVDDEQSDDDNLLIEFEDDTEIEQIEDEEQEQKEKQTPPTINENILKQDEQSVPIYETDIPTTNQEDEMPFKIGDKVYHPKHGNGIVEGFANYSNKILFCQIDFENVGRRIMDPRVSGLEKVS